MGGIKDRKLKILNAIIKDYIINAEPIGSRTIAKKYKLGVSPATIRNEMSDLEGMGFLIQPHTSAGRIPSEKAYRLYVDQLMQIRKLDGFIEESIVQSYEKLVEQLDKSIELTAKLLSQLTSYTSLVLSPEMKSLNIKLIQLLPLQDERILMVIISEPNTVKNYEITLSQSANQSELTKLTNIFNYYIKEHDIGQLNTLTEKIDELSIKENTLLQEIIEVIKKVYTSTDESSVYYTGITNILSYPEFSDVEKAKNFIEVFQEKTMIAEILRQYTNGINIVIGNENEIVEFKDCSLLTSTYQLDGENIGTIGVIGPIRMNYDHVVSVLDFLSEVLNQQINKEK